MFLHAHSLSFIWPDSGSEQSFSSPLPPQLRAVLDQLGAKRARPRVKDRATAAPRQRPVRRR
jgi:hypothetical protein